jgi:23S rRNA maturation-related 3'-5' exoribonuclease YhaM
MRYGQTPYHKRIAHRLARSRMRQIEHQNNRYTEIDSFMVVFERAYQEYYRIPCKLQYKHGWYYLHGKRYRHHQMERKLAMLFARLQELDSPNPDEDIQDDRSAA